MWHSKSFLIGIALGLFLSACGSHDFAEKAATRSFLNVEVDDQDFAQNSGDSLNSEVDSATSEGLGDDPKSSGKSSHQGKGNEEQRACAKSISVAEQMIRVAGSSQKMAVSSQNLVFSRVTGDQNELELTLKGSPESAALAGVCLFIAGHQNKVHIRIEHPVAAIYLKVRGDQASVTMEISKEASLNKLSWDARGNKPSLDIIGPGVYSCPQSSSENQVNCR